VATSNKPASNRGLYIVIGFVVLAFVGANAPPTHDQIKEQFQKDQFESCMNEFAQQIRTEMYGRASSQAFCKDMQRLRSAPR
jgi:hypothetical protein